MSETKVKTKKKKKETRGRKPGKYYVANEELVKEVKHFYKTDEFTEVLGKYILKIVDGVAHSPNFMGYSYLDDMRSDAIFRVTKAITDKGCKIIPDEQIGDICKDDEGHVIYKVNKTNGEFVTDPDGNKKPLLQEQNNLFGYFSMIAWRAFQNRIKVEKKYHNTSENYRDKVFEDFENEFALNHSEENENGDFFDENS